MTFFGVQLQLFSAAHLPHCAPFTQLPHPLPVNTENHLAPPVIGFYGVVRWCEALPCPSAVGFTQLLCVARQAGSLSCCVWPAGEGPFPCHPKKTTICATVVLAMAMVMAVVSSADAFTCHAGWDVARYAKPLALRSALSRASAGTCHAVNACEGALVRYRYCWYAAEHPFSSVWLALVPVTYVLCVKRRCLSAVTGCKHTS